MNITDADRDAAHSYLRGQVRRTFQGDTDLHKQYLTESFAAHRLRTLEDAVKAVESERLEYPDYETSDEVYETAITDAVDAIRAMIEGADR